MDSPLLQRLRRIRQLGVVHWVYPTAGHSRLEHTLGVVHQVQRVADALNHTVDGDQAKGVPKEWTNILRLSALLHDIGHGLMSHVVENALRFHVPTEALLGEIADDFERIYEGAVFESVKLSEAAAFYMIGSQAFKELFGELRGKFSYHLPVASTEEAVELIRRAVLGQKICEKRILLHEIINGPYDADKLDYMRRDAKMCGLPIVTDIERLIRKLQIVDVPEGKLPERLAKLVQGGSGQTYHVTAIAPSGAQVLDEMMLGRALLSDKVYRHQKVRAIELMVTKMFSLLVGLLVEESEIASLILALEDHLFVDFEWDAISRVLGSERAGSDSQVSLLKNLAERIKHRRPFVRAYSFAQNMWDNQSELEQRERVGVSLLQDHVKRPERCRDLDRKLAGIIRQMQALVPLEFPSIGELSPEDYEHFIGFDPSCPPETSQFTRAFIHQGMQVLQRFERASGESAAWANAYMLTRDLGYVFAAEELRFAAYLAAEVLCFREYQVRTAPNAMAWSKLDDKRIDGLRRSLTEAGFYAEDILPLRFKPKALTNAAAKRAIQQIVNNLKDYNGLTTHEGKAAPVRVTSDRVEEFLLQFRDEDIETMFRVLSQIKILGRSEVHLGTVNY
ncbi:MAG: HD domain-containing protein [Vulcanimicrobiota bacterium]